MIINLISVVNCNKIHKNNGITFAIGVVIGAHALALQKILPNQPNFLFFVIALLSLPNMSCDECN